jgi:hypothetical protein
MWLIALLGCGFALVASPTIRPWLFVGAFYLLTFGPPLALLIGLAVIFRWVCVKICDSPSLGPLPPRLDDNRWEHEGD